MSAVIVTQLEERVWLGSCVLSLVLYLLFSEALAQFGSEVVRLAGKL
ncbi:MAG: hypothetical protein GY842_15890 [bacterium]|nr:hypothetical protein [bacterium]